MIIGAWKSGKMMYLLTAVTFFLNARFQIWTHFWKRGAILYNICENQPKIPILSCISHVEAKTVKKCTASIRAARIAEQDSSMTLL